LKLRGKLRSTTTVKKFSPNTGLTFLNTETSKSADKEENTLSQLSMFSAEASPVNLIALRENVEQAPTNATSGLNTIVLFASLDRAMCWVKTCWDFLAQKAVISSAEYSETYPKQGTMRNGQLYERQISARHTDVNASLLWRTPCSRDHHPSSGRYTEGRITSQAPQIQLAHQVKMNWPTPTAIDAGTGRINKSLGANAQERPTLAYMAHYNQWPTPTANDAKNATLPPSQESRDGIAGTLRRTGYQGTLNPDWVEMLQGYPVGWTDIDGLLDQDNHNTSTSLLESSRSDKRTA